MAKYEGRRESTPTTRVFRDRVVSLEQTFEIGEKYLDVLLELLQEAFPGFEYKEHDLEHEQDLFFITLEGPSGERRRVFFSRMFLADSTCLPAIVQERHASARARVLESLQSQEGQNDVTLRFRSVMNDEDKAIADLHDAEWRKRQEALVAAERAREKKRHKGQKEQQRPRHEKEPRPHQEPRRKAEPREEAPRPTVVPASPQPAQAPAPAGALGGKKEKRRGRGGRRDRRPERPSQVSPTSEHPPAVPAEREPGMPVETSAPAISQPAVESGEKLAAAGSEKRPQRPRSRGRAHQRPQGAPRDKGPRPDPVQQEPVQVAEPGESAPQGGREASKGPGEEKPGQHQRSGRRFWKKNRQRRGPSAGSGEGPKPV